MPWIVFPRRFSPAFRVFVTVSDRTSSSSRAENRIMSYAALKAWIGKKEMARWVWWWRWPFWSAILGLRSSLVWESSLKSRLSHSNNRMDPSQSLGRLQVVLTARNPYANEATMRWRETQHVHLPRASNQMRNCYRFDVSCHAVLLIKIHLFVSVAIRISLLAFRCDCLFVCRGDWWKC